MSNKNLSSLCPPNPGQKWDYKNGKNNVTSDIPNCLIENGKILVAISQMYGGPRISDEANEIYYKKTGKKYPNNRVPQDKISRTDPNLINLIKEMGSNVNGEVYGFPCSKWVIIPVEQKHYKSLEIQDYDGLETIIADKC